MTQAQGVRDVQNAFWRATEQLLYHHTNPWELDEALCNWGYTRGPCEAQDLRGLEQVLAQAETWPGPVLPRMVSEGRQGKSSGVGFYRYPGGGGAVIDPLIEDLILEEAWFGKVTRSELSDAQVVVQMHRALFTECRFLAEINAEDPVHLLARAIHFPAGKKLLPYSASGKE